MISQCLLGHEEIGEKYTLVNDILSASNYYEALGLSDDSTCDEIRRAYIKVCVFGYCHFDLFMHHYTREVEFATLINLYHHTRRLLKVSSVCEYATS